MEVHCDLQNVSDDAPLSEYDRLYHDQDRNQRTAITTAFFSLRNLTWLNNQIGIETGQLLNRNVRVVPNNQFFIYLETLLRGVANLSDVSDTVCRLNQMVLKNEVPEQYRGLRRRELFFKWFFFKDRPRVISRPVNTNGRFRYNGISNGDYAMSSPNKRYWADFQREQQKLKCENQIPAMFSAFYAR